MVFCTIFDVLKRIMDFAKGPVMSQDPKVIEAKEEVVGKGVVPNEVASRQNTPKLIKFFQNCSIYTNTAAIFRIDNGGKVTCLNGIRSLSMIWIVFGHTFNYIANRDKFFLMGNLNPPPPPLTLCLFNILLNSFFCFVRQHFCHPETERRMVRPDHHQCRVRRRHVFSHEVPIFNSNSTHQNHFRVLYCRL